MSIPKPGKPAPLHELCELFPPMNAEEYKALLGDIKINGQRTDIVILDGKVLDGANRQKAVLELGGQPKYREYDYKADGQHPINFIAAQNLHRRNLSASQRAAIGADILERIQKLGQKAGAAPAPAGKAADSKTPPPANGAAPGTAAGAAPKRTKAKAGAGKAAVAAAAAAGSTSRSVERAARIKKADPKLHADVKAGKTTLGAGEKKLTAAERAQRDFKDAVGRITQICGKSLGEAVAQGSRLKGKGEAAKFAALDEKKMLAIRGLIESGWKLGPALKYKLVTIARTHKISDLLTRAEAQPGVATGSAFTLEIEKDGTQWEISVKKLAKK